MGVSVGVSRGGSWTGLLFGDSLEVLYEATEDICARGRVRGGVEHIASCHCWQKRPARLTGVPSVSYRT
jgi:hypothetical protein